jgi:anti-sigma factor (TIGR02949 family)
MTTDGDTMSETTIISCEEALRLLAEHLDGELDDNRREEVAKHLSRCRSCFSRSEFEQRLKSQLGALRQQPVESAFEERIRALIGQFAIVRED